ncbi:MAG: M14 family metallocarboxypeptidase [Armatimonadetes bacterium]|nr:M14 family metallocarboxypeptidase [Armatimonadota bacterium]
MVYIRKYDNLIQRVQKLAGHSSLELQFIGEFTAGDRACPILKMHLGEPGLGKVRVLIASGIHGDEPAGVEAVLKFIEQNLDNDILLNRFVFTIFPCNNPTGWERNTRENWRGIDLNREFAARKPEPEAEIVMQSLQGECFDLVFEMHEDTDARGFYLYEIAEDESYHIGEVIIDAVAAMGYPVNPGECIEGLPAKEGLIRRKSFKFRKTRVPQAIYIYRTCGGHVLTLEPPASVLPLEDRVKILLTGLELALEAAI